jgi:hypothetical protein
MTDRAGRPSRTVGVYDRPHPLRTRKVLVPVAVFVAIVVAYGIYFLLR